MLISFDLPKCVHICIETEAFLQCKSLSLKSIFLSYSFSIDLPSLSVFSIAKGAFYQTYQVTLESSFFITVFIVVDFPFSTGVITWNDEDRLGKHSFSTLCKSEIHSDDSMMITKKV